MSRAFSPARVARVQLGEHFPILDTLRAVGALAVVTTHAGFNSSFYSEFGAIGRLVARLDVGVAIFFVLSGFLLSRPWLARARAGQAHPPVTRYLWKRFLRIVPPFLVVALAALLLIDDNDGLGPRGWLSALTMTDIYVSQRLPFGLTQTWSLATEVAFYLMLPVLMAIAVGRRRLVPRRVGALLGVLAVVNVVWLLGGSARFPVENGHVNEWLPAYLTWFCVGIVLAMVQVVPEHDGRVPRVVRQLAASPGACWVIVLGLMLVAGTSVAGPTLLVPATQGEALTKNLLYAAVATLVVLPGIFATPGGRYGRVMSHPALRHLGLISYGIFLIHMPVLHLVMWWTGYQLFGGHFLQILGLTVLLSVVLAEVLYRLVELPSQRLKDLGRRSAATTTDTERAIRTR